MTSLAPGGATAATGPDAQQPARNAHPARPAAKTPLGQFLFWLMLGVLTIIFLAPLVWMISTSFKTPEASTSLELSWLPQPWDISAYQTLFSAGSANPVLRWFFNSMFSAAANAVLIVAVDAAAAYALARMDFPGKKLIFTSVITTIFLPAFVFLIPNFLIVSRLGWLDSLWAIIVPSAGGAFGVFFLRQFFSTLPKELEEAAIIDGANQWKIFVKVILPLSRPALSTLAVLSFLTNWNDFLWPVYVLFSPETQTLPSGLAKLQNAATVNYPIIMAGAVVASVPVILIFIIAQRQVIESVSRSGLKG
ncbi:MAG TPA: carbohydrate ABC transporter permease [Jatrophihabitans sp.]|jgi:multiple sugar transport system permease protein|uniref:carbohydrate ABC transporter permease n=1 Tax=Jatrophihabitans sp. TaxID=1932789 RepID=UPI002F0DF853